MRTAFFVFFLLVFSSDISAQCIEFQLVDLQSLQRIPVAQKESHIRGLGFDLNAKVGNSFRYNKCWNTNRKGKAIYDQVLYWNTSSGNITYLTPDEEAFLALRKSIEGRHGQTSTLGASDIYIGQMFRYQFGSRWLDGVMHWSVEISNR